MAPRTSRLTPRRLRTGFAAALLLGVLGTVLLGGASSAKKPKPKPAADTVMLDGRVLGYKLPGDRVDRMEQVKAKYSSAVAVRNGRISYVGDDKGARKLIGPFTRVIDLDGKLVMPGMIDTHIHGARPSACDLNYMPATDLDAVLAKIKECLLREDQLPFLEDENSLLRVTGFSSVADPDQVNMNRYVLDRLSEAPGDDPQGAGTTRPIQMNFSGGHSQWVNSRALEVAGIDENTPNPPGGDIAKDENGIPTGVLTDVSGFFFGTAPPLSPDASFRAAVSTVESLTRSGVTGAFMAGGGAGNLALWKQVADAGELTMYMNQGLSASDVRGVNYATADAFAAGLNDLRDQYDGYHNAGAPGEIAVDTTKISCDGVPDFPGQTAAMHDPYNVNVGTPEDPVYVPGTERGEDPSCADGLPGFQALHDNRWNIMTHSLGDRAVSDSLDNYAAIQRRNPSWDSRHIVTHGEFVRPSDVKRFGQADVIYNPQAQWIAANGFIEGLIRPYVTEKAYRTQFPLRSVMKARGVVAGGSDWPVDPLNEWLMLQTAVTRQSALASDREAYPGPLGRAKERLERVQSVFMHTMASAYQLHVEDRTGSIEVGKDADLVIASQDVLSPRVSVHEIGLTTSLLTMFRGNVVWEAPSDG